jgi:hypothetical protein
MPNSVQKSFNPVKYGFRWVGDWYEFDSKMGSKAAQAARRELAKELKAKGYRVKLWSLRDQLVSRGGIGSGHPHIELWVNVPMLDASR